MTFATEQTFIFIKVTVGYDVSVTAKTNRFKKIIFGAQIPQEI